MLGSDCVRGKRVEGFIVRLVLTLPLPLPSPLVRQHKISLLNHHKLGPKEQLPPRAIDQAPLNFLAYSHYLMHLEILNIPLLTSTDLSSKLYEILSSLPTTQEVWRAWRQHPSPLLHIRAAFISYGLHSLAIPKRLPRGILNTFQDLPGWKFLGGGGG